MNEQLVQHIVDEQAEDPRLWFPIGERGQLNQLQVALRKLHAAIDGQQYYIGEAIDLNESDT